MRAIIHLIAFLLLLGLGACRDPYNPEVRPGQIDLLVVEGVISPGDSATRIRLSRTVALNETTRLRPEEGAQVWVEAEDNTHYPLVALGGGEYLAPRLQLDGAQQYRLKIQTREGKLYASGLQPLKQTPAVSVGWTRSPEGVQIHFSARNPQNSSRYYKWDYDETWEIRSPYIGIYKYSNGAIIDRDPAEIRLMSLCWARRRTNTIKLVTTATLSEDSIDREPVLLIPRADEKLTVKYSVRVTLHALNQGGFEFFQLLKKNTESLGTIFDPQPSELPGNVVCLTNPEEQVIGYVAVSQMREHRIFITKDDVPNWNHLSGCRSVRVDQDINAVRAFMDDALIPYGVDGFPVTKWLGVERPCGDCRTRGNNIRPDFW